MSVSVSAPGKAFLIGEYAVLEGAPSLVTAVDVRAVAHDPLPGEPLPQVTSVVRCAHARVVEYLQQIGVAAAGDDGFAVVDTGRFHAGSRKLGLGSSAAVTAAVVGYHLTAHGLDPRDPEVLSDALELAMAAHAEAQGGGGSGADVAAAVLGGTLRFQAGKATPVRPLPGLHMGFVDAGYPAITSELVRRVRQGQAAHPEQYEAAMAVLSDAARRFIDAYLLPEGVSSLADAELHERFARLLQATAAHNQGLRMLQEMAGVTFVTAEIATIIEQAEALGLAAKPSGASGGDLVMVLATDRSQLDRLGERLRRIHGLVMRTDLVGHAEGLRADRRPPTNSRLGGFFRLSVDERRRAICEATGVPMERLAELDAGSFDVHRANHMIENVVGTLELPLAIATNFRINGRDYLVPMCVEEASVVAAASNAAKMIRAGGGFAAHSDPPWMIAQVQLYDVPDNAAAVRAILARRDELVAACSAAQPGLVRRGGGARELQVRELLPSGSRQLGMLVVHVLADCCDAMGANLVNTMAEAIAAPLAELSGGQFGLRILSNLADRRLARARCSTACRT